MKDQIELERELQIELIYNSLVYLISQLHNYKDTKKKFITTEEDRLNNEVKEIINRKGIKTPEQEQVQKKTQRIATSFILPKDLRLNFGELKGKLFASMEFESAPYVNIEPYVETIFPKWQDALAFHLSSHSQITKHKGLIKYFLYFLDALFENQSIDGNEIQTNTSNYLVTHKRIEAIKQIIENSIVESISTALSINEKEKGIIESYLSLLEKIHEELILSQNEEIINNVYNTVILNIAKNNIKIVCDNFLERILWKAQEIGFFAYKFSDENGFTIIQHAVQEGQNNLLRHLLETFAPHWLNEVYININSDSVVGGGNLLHLACTYKQKECFNELLSSEKHATLDPNSQTIKGGLTPLHLLTKDINSSDIEYEMIGTLLNNEKTKIDFQNIEGKSAIHYAVLKKDKKALTLLMEKHANISLLTNNQSSVLHIVSKEGTYEDLLHLFAVYQKNMQHLISLQDADGNTPLHLAVQNTRQGIQGVQLLLSQQAEPLKRNINNETPYDIAEKNNSIEIMTLLPHEENNESRKLKKNNNSSSFTKLSINNSSKFNNTQSLSILPELAKETSVKTKTSSQESLNTLFLNSLTTDLGFLYSESMTGNTHIISLTHAIKTKNHCLFNFLFCSSISNINPEEHKIILHYGAKYNNVYAINYLLSNAESLRFDQSLILQEDSYRMNPLYYAGYYGHQKVIEAFFLHLNTSTNFTSQHSSTINRLLYYAVLGNNPIVTQYLLNEFEDIIDPSEIYKQESHLNALSALHISSILNADLFLLLSGFLMFKKNINIFETHETNSLHPLHIMYFYGKEDLIYRTTRFIRSIENKKGNQKTPYTMGEFILNASSEQNRKLTVYEEVLDETVINAVYSFTDVYTHPPVFYGIKNNNISSIIYNSITDQVFDWSVEFDRIDFVQKYLNNYNNDNKNLAQIVEQAFALAIQHKSIKSLQLLIDLTSQSSLIQQTAEQQDPSFTHVKILSALSKQGLYDSIEYYLEKLQPEISVIDMTSLVEACSHNGYLPVICILQEYFRKNSLSDSTIQDIYSAGIRSASENKMLRTLEYLLASEMKIIFENEKINTSNSYNIYIDINYHQSIFDLLALNYFVVTGKLHLNRLNRSVKRDPLLYATYGHSIGFIEQTLISSKKGNYFDIIEVIHDACHNLLPSLWMYRSLLSIEFIDKNKLFSIGNDTPDGTLFGEIIERHNDKNAIQHNESLCLSAKTLLQIYPQQINSIHNMYGHTALHIAIKNKNRTMFDFLMTYKNLNESITIQNENLAYETQPENQFILNIEIQDAQELTPLNLACSLYIYDPSFYSQTITTLIQQGANINTTTSDNYFPMRFLCEHALTMYEEDNSSGFSYIQNTIESILQSQHIESLNFTNYETKYLLSFYIIRYHLLQGNYQSANFEITDRLYSLVTMQNQNNFQYMDFLNLIQYHIGYVSINYENISMKQCSNDETIKTFNMLLMPFIVKTEELTNITSTNGMNSITPVLYKNFHEKYKTDLMFQIYDNGWKGNIIELSMNNKNSLITKKVFRLCMNNKNIEDVIEFSWEKALEMQHTGFLDIIYQEAYKILENSHTLAQSLLRKSISHKNLIFAQAIMQEFGANIHEKCEPYKTSVLDIMEEKKRNVLDQMYRLLENINIPLLNDYTQLLNEIDITLTNIVNSNISTVDKATYANNNQYAQCLNEIYLNLRTILNSSILVFYDMKKLPNKEQYAQWRSEIETNLKDSNNKNEFLNEIEKELKKIESFFKSKKPANFTQKKLTEAKLTEESKRLLDEYEEWSTMIPHFKQLQQDVDNEKNRNTKNQQALLKQETVEPQETAEQSEILTQPLLQKSTTEAEKTIKASYNKPKTVTKKRMCSSSLKDNKNGYSELPEHPQYPYANSFFNTDLSEQKSPQTSNSLPKSTDYDDVTHKQEESSTNQQHQSSEQNSENSDNDFTKNIPDDFYLNNEHSSREYIA